jgi:hypothetical protein
MKLAFWILLACNLLFFAIMQLGGALSTPRDDPNLLPEYQADKIRLSVPASAPPPAVAASAPAKVAQATASSVATCGNWGEFSGDELTRAEKLVAATLPAQRWSKRYLERSHGFWVYLPPHAGKALLNKRISELRASGFDDFFVVREEGPLLGAISLGLFNQSEAGEKLLARLRAKGIKDARLAPYLTRNTYATFSLHSPTEVEMASLKQRYPAVRFTAEACAAR